MKIECTHEKTDNRKGVFSVIIYRDAGEPVKTSFAYGAIALADDEMNFEQAQAAALSFHEGAIVMFETITPKGTLEAKTASVIRNAQRW
jgi:hypothetical protein